MFRNMRNFVMVGLVMGLLVLPAFSATTVFSYSNDFSSDATGWTNAANAAVNRFQVSGTAASHLGAGGTDWILGPFGNPYQSPTTGPVQVTQTVKITLTSATAFDAITLNFQLWAINSWDGNGQTIGAGNYTPDFFQVAVGGNQPTGACGGSALCTTFGEKDVKQAYNTGDFNVGTQAQNTKPALFAVTNPNPGAQTYFTNIGGDHQFSGYAVYNINLGTINLGQSVNSLTIYFRGLFSGTLQTGNDESWALSSVNVSGISNATGGGEIPEPSTIVLGGLGLAFLALAKMRSRKA